MDFLMKALFLVLITFQLIACGASDDSEDEQLVSCHGYNSPSITVSVLDSQDDSSIDGARVDVTYMGSTISSTEAIYASESKTYVGTLADGGYESLAVVVSVNNYHTYIGKRKVSATDASCGAENALEFTVYLCAVGTACI
jgi:hypothetical protein